MTLKAPTEPRFADNAARTSNRAELEALIQNVFSQLSHVAAVDRLTQAQTAFGAMPAQHTAAASKH